MQKNVLFLSIILLISLLSLFSCTSDKKNRQHTITPAFYHWKTDFQLSNFEKGYAKSLNSKKLYIKFFDIDWNGNEAIPQASLQIKNPSVKGEIIPTIFITNRTFKNLKKGHIEDLVKKIDAKIKRLLEKFPSQKIQEIQFDCDWSESTKTTYFSFLELFKKQLKNSSISLSATIRLHQIKFFKKTGVPPVQRGMLMFYNTGRLKEWETNNSILDISTAKKYLVNFDEYPLDLDLALPLFHWGILFREGKMIRIINNLEEADLTDSLFFQKLENNKFSIKTETYLKGHYIYEGDKIRLENIDLKTLNEAALLLQKEIKTKNMTLAFYHIDSLLIQHYDREKLKKIIKLME